jgi:TolB protein
MWSPDGEFIAFSAWEKGQPDIYVVSAEGGEPRRLTEDNSQDQFPSWSVDGRWIYFRSVREGKNGIWRVSCLSKISSDIECGCQQRQA